jgi:hypothetical protein
MAVMTSAYYLAWWNVENLFDEENSPRRTDKVARALGSSIVGWTPALRDRKIDQLALVIAQLNGGTGPDLLGMPPSSPLQPAVLLRYVDGFHPVAAAGLADGAGQVVADGAVTQEQPGGDLGDARAVLRLTEDVGLAGSQRVVPGRQRLRSQLGVDDTQAGMYSTDRIGELVGGSILDDEAARPRLHGSAQVTSAHRNPASQPRPARPPPDEGGVDLRLRSWRGRCDKTSR